MKGSLPRSSSKWNTDQRWQYNQNSHNGKVKPPHCLGPSSNENGFSSRDGKARRWPCRPAEATDGSQALPLQFRVGKWMLSKRSSKLYKADPPAIVGRPRVEGPSQSKKDSVHPLNITPSCNQTRLNQLSQKTLTHYIVHIVLNALVLHPGAAASYKMARCLSMAFFAARVSLRSQGFRLQLLIKRLQVDALSRLSQPRKHVNCSRSTAQGRRTLWSLKRRPVPLKPSFFLAKSGSLQHTYHGRETLVQVQWRCLSPSLRLPQWSTCKPAQFFWLWVFDDAASHVLGLGRAGGKKVRSMLQIMYMAYHWHASLQGIRGFQTWGYP